MAEPHPRPGLIEMPPEIFLAIGEQISTHRSLLSFMQCSKRIRIACQRLAFREIKFGGTQKAIESDIRDYMSNQHTLDMGELRRNIRSLRIFIEPPPPVHVGHLPRPASLNRDNDPAPFFVAALPKRILWLLEHSPKLEVLFLDLEHLGARNSETFYGYFLPAPTVNLPRATHLRLRGTPQITSAIVEFCAAPSSLTSLHLQVPLGFPSAALLTACRLQTGLRRLRLTLYHDDIVGTVPGPLHHSRLDPSIRTHTLVEAAQHLPQLEWLSLTTDIRPHQLAFNSTPQRHFLSYHIGELITRLRWFPNLRRFAFTIPRDQIGRRILPSVPLHGTEQQRRNQYFLDLAERIMLGVQHLDHIYIIVQANRYYKSSRRPEGGIFTRRLPTDEAPHYDFPLGLRGT